jgi:hypothetical protein
MLVKAMGAICPTAHSSYRYPLLVFWQLDQLGTLPCMDWYFLV